MLKIDVTEEKENPFLKRKELMLMVDHKGLPTPKKDELEQTIAEKYKTDTNKVEIVYIFSHAGETKSKIKARVWKEKIVEKPKKEEKPREEKKEIEKEKKPEVKEELKESKEGKKKEEKKPEKKEVKKEKKDET